MKTLPFRPIYLPEQAATKNDSKGENGVNGCIGINNLGLGGGRDRRLRSHLRFGGGQRPPPLKNSPRPPWGS